MKPTVIYLPEETDLALQDLAKQKGKTPSEIIQEMLNQHLLYKKKELPKCIGMGKSGMSDLSERVDELLWQENK
jgi:hypothetical protein